MKKNTLYKNTSFKKYLISFGHCQNLSGWVSGTHQTLVEVLLISAKI